ncbi:Lsr2 protein [Plantibacter flavus]|uniref:Lsr2 protein n=1 Tax=Plantibacter flavus TaxID=150123 RepID=A0A3N2BL52_9MICO|nr:Lsr2 family protein [Plantibacter flavus]ROR75995.1 Lsr2 protein [Plantibacter flavus]SMG49522.1 Lsr2 protein [Plantibacter flavus]
MAKRTVVTLVDDIDGTEIAPGAGDTVRFGIDGRNFEIDLREETAAELREQLRPFVEAGRRVVIPRTRRRRP